jgi:hypothetical protein
MDFVPSFGDIVTVALFDLYLIIPAGIVVGMIAHKIFSPNWHRIGAGRQGRR